MSAIRRTLTLACPVILFAVASVQLARQILAHYPDTAVLCARIKFHYNALPWVSASAAWVLAMFLPVAVFALWVERLFSKKLLVLMSEGGHPLKIREVAINQYIHDDVMALPFVRQARVASRAVSGALALKVRVWVISAGPLDGLQNRMLDRITSAARVGLGISQVADIDLRFEAVRLTRAEAKKRASEGKADRQTDASTPSTDPSRPDEAGLPSFAPPETENRTLQGSGPSEERKPEQEKV